MNKWVKRAKLPAAFLTIDRFQRRNVEKRKKGFLSTLALYGRAKCPFWGLVVSLAFTSERP
jgi:hypothetical protein